MSEKKIAEWTIVEDITSIKKIDIILASIQKMSEKIDSMENKMDSLENKIDSMENKIDSLENKMDSMENKMDSPAKSESVDNKIDLSEDKSVERKLNTCWRKSYLTTTPNLGLKYILTHDTMNKNNTNLIYKTTNINKLD